MDETEVRRLASELLDKASDLESLASSNVSKSVPVGREEIDLSEEQEKAVNEKMKAKCDEIGDLLDRIEGQL